jgi:hypothetical protein
MSRITVSKLSGQISETPTGQDLPIKAGIGN